MASQAPNDTDAETALAQASQGAPEHDRAVTGIRLASGEYHVLSRYGDRAWRLPDTLFGTMTKESDKWLNFDRIPPAFEVPLKAALLRYYLHGREGSRRPRGETLRQFHNNIGLYLRYLASHGIERLQDVSTLITSQYVDACRAETTQKGQPLRKESLHLRFKAIEALHELSRDTTDPMPHPWPDASAALLAGVTGGHSKEGKTPVIPDEVLSDLFQQSERVLESADRLLEHWDAEAEWRRQGYCYNSRRNWLRQRGYEGHLVDLSKDIDELLDACMLIVLITSGIRVSELASLQRGCAYSTIGSDGERYYWMEGWSEKTHEGKTSWLVPGIAHRALRVAERTTKPFQERLEGHIAARDDNDPEADELKRHRQAIFLGRTKQQGNPIRTLSRLAIQYRINRFAQARGHDWQFTPHQFRRTFAVYAAHSAYSDLRYLSEHFKHWSLDMTALYAMDERQDLDLYDEVLAEVREIKVEVTEHLLDEETALSGGMAGPMRHFRSSQEPVTTYKSHREMAETVSETVYLRATGVGWCTADFGGCNGGHGLEATKCADCVHSVISETQQPIWEAMYEQQLELRAINDIGPGGTQRVERDIQRCRKVLRELGAELSDFEEAS